MYAFLTSLYGNDGWILGQDGANRLLLLATQAVMRGSILTCALGISLRWSDREKFFLWPYKKSFIIDPLVGQYGWILAKFLLLFFLFL